MLRYLPSRKVGRQHGRILVSVSPMSGNGNRIAKSFSTSVEMWDAIEEEAHRRGVSLSHIVNEALGMMMRTKIDRDAWDTIDSSEHYDPLKFYTSSEDRRGHSGTLKFAVPKNVMGQIKRIIDAGQIPEYRGLSDFGRDAIMHRAKFLAQALDDGVLNAEVDMHLMISEQERIQQQKSDFEHLRTMSAANITDAFGRRDYEWIRETLGQLSAQTTNIPERYRDQWVMFLQEQHDKLERESPSRNDLARRRKKA